LFGRSLIVLADRSPPFPLSFLPSDMNLERPSLPSTMTVCPALAPLPPATSLSPPVATTVHAMEEGNQHTKAVTRVTLLTLATATLAVLSFIALLSLGSLIVAIFAAARG
jgi:hypothetical protein